MKKNDYLTQAAFGTFDMVRRLPSFIADGDSSWLESPEYSLFSFAVEYVIAEHRAQKLLPAPNAERN